MSAKDSLHPAWSDMRLTIIMSLFCNIRCNFCFQESFDKAFSLSDEVLFQKIAPLFPHTNSILLQGGEVSALPNGFAFLKYLSDNYPGIWVRLTTNGVTLTEAWLREIVANDVSVGVSLNASNPETFQKILAHGGGDRIWNKVYTNLFKLIKARDRAGSESFVELSMVLTEDSVGDLRGFAKLCYALGLDARISYDCRTSQYSSAIEVSFGELLFLQRVCADRITIGCVNGPPAARGFAERFWGGEHRLAEYEDFAREFRDELEVYQFPLGYSLEQDAEPVVAGWIPPLRNSVAHKNLRLSRQGKSVATEPRFLERGGRKVCAEPWGSMVFMAQGTVLFCCQTPNYPLGDIRKQSVDEIWNGDAAVAFRKLMLEGDYRHCDVNCPANLGHAHALARADEAFARGDFAQARDLFRDVEATIGADAGRLYKFAYCEHLVGDKGRAIELYTEAMARGFDPFWVLYHRGQIYLSQLREREAIEDLRRASQLNQDHKGCRDLLDSLDRASNGGAAVVEAREV